MTDDMAKPTISVVNDVSYAVVLVPIPKQDFQAFEAGIMPSIGAMVGVAPIFPSMSPFR